MRWPVDWMCWGGDAHSGEKPFNCTQCDYSCTTTSHLRQHISRHPGEKHSVVSSVAILTLKRVT